MLAVKHKNTVTSLKRIEKKNTNQENTIFIISRTGQLCFLI